MSTKQEKFTSPLENKSIKKKITADIDNFWEDCIELLKVNDSNNIIVSSEIAETDDHPDDYITCKFISKFSLININS